MILTPMPEVVSGKASLDALDRFLSRCKVKRVAVITGPRVRKIHGFQDILASASSGNRMVFVYDGTQADPTFDGASDACCFAKGAGAQAVGQRRAQAAQRRGATGLGLLRALCDRNRHRHGSTSSVGARVRTGAGSQPVVPDDDWTPCRSGRSRADSL